MIKSVYENLSAWKEQCFNNDTLNEIYNNIPFISRSLLLDSQGNYISAIDKEKVKKKEKNLPFIILIVTAVALPIFLTNFQSRLPSVISKGATIVSESEPLVVLTMGIYLLSVFFLGGLISNLDKMLTVRTATKIAIHDYLNNETPSSDTFNWLIEDNERIKQLLNKNNIDLSKKDTTDGNTLLEKYMDYKSKKDTTDGNTLLEKYMDYKAPISPRITDPNEKQALKNKIKNEKMELILKLWDKSANPEKAKIFIAYLYCYYKLSYFFSSHEQNSKISEMLHFFLDKNMISPNFFTEDQQNLLSDLFVDLTNHYFHDEDTKSHDDKVQLFKKFMLAGFCNIDTKNKSGNSIRDRISTDILDVVTGFRVSEKDKKCAWASLNLLQILAEIQTDQLGPYSADFNLSIEQLKIILPHLSQLQKGLNKAAASQGKIEVVLLLWDHLKEEEKKTAFLGALKLDSARFAIALMNTKRMSGTMYPQNEHCQIFQAALCESKVIYYKMYIRILNGVGFNINARNKEGKNIRLILNELSDNLSSKNIVHKERKIYIANIIKAVDEISSKAGTFLKFAVTDETSNFNVLPKDVMNYISFMMLDEEKKQEEKKEEKEVI